MCCTSSLNSALDIMALLDAFEHFGRDRFPRDNVRADKHPGDCEAQFHRMNGPGMWFNWAGQLECAFLLLGKDDQDHAIRVAMMNCLVLGCSTDFVFRKMPSGQQCEVETNLQRGKTLSEYKPDVSTERLIRKRVFRMLNKWGRSSSAMRRLYRVFEGIES